MTATLVHTPLSVKIFGATGNGTTDDTVAIQRALTANAGSFVDIPSGTYKISAPLVIYAGTTLRLSDAATITLAAGSNCSMLLNQAVNGTSPVRDTGIHITGGTWARGANAGSGTSLHSLRFRRVDNFTIENVLVTSSAGKYSVNIADATNFIARGLRFNSASDGIHIGGPAVRGAILNTAGTTGDDLVALTSADYAAYSDTSGDITDILISGVQAVAGLQAAVKITGNAANTIRRVTVRDVTGTCQRGISVIDDYTIPGGGVLDVGDLLIDGVALSSTGAESVVVVNASLGRNIVMRNISRPVGSGPVVTLAAQCVLESVVVDGVQMQAASQIGVTVIGLVQFLSVSRIRSWGAFASVYGVDVVSTGTARRILVDDVEMQKPAGGDPVVRLTGGTNNVDSIVMSNIILTGGGRAIRMTTGTTPVKVMLSNFVGDACYDLVQTASALDLTLNGIWINAADAGALIKLTGASAGLVLRGDGAIVNFQNREGVSRDGSQSIRVIAQQFPADLSILAKTNGDAANNTNAALACGVGPATSNGTNWRNVYTGTVY